MALFGFLNDEIISDVERVCLSLNVPYTDATATFTKDGTFCYHEGKNGWTTDAYKTLRALAHHSPCEIIGKDVPPEIDVEILRENTVKICSFSTSYATSSSARKKNVELAASRLDGTVVPSGGELSFNFAVGARTTNNGFCEAKVIQNGEYTAGVGGGVCQVSTTLYNAWLLSGQTVISSRPHSLVPSYVRPGLDAMVSESSDLVLRNEGSFPVYIDASFDGKKVTFTLYGPKPEYDVILSSELVRSVPYEEYEEVEGENDEILVYPKPRQIYRSYRIYKENGKEEDRELLRISDYLPQKGKKIIKKKDNTKENDTQ